MEANENQATEYEMSSPSDVPNENNPPQSVREVHIDERGPVNEEGPYPQVPYAENAVQEKLSFTPTFLVTSMGLLKIFELILALAFGISLSIFFSYHEALGTITNIVAWLIFVLQLIYFLVDLFDGVKFMPGPWRLVELAFYCLALILVLLGSVISVIYALGKYEANASIVFASLFGGLQTIIYFPLIVLTFLQMRSETLGE